MACCRGRHIMKMDCIHSGPGMAMCTMCRSSHPTPDYGLAAPIAPFQLSAGVPLPAPGVARTNFDAMTVSDFAGYFPPPFNPPRA